MQASPSLPNLNLHWTHAIGRVLVPGNTGLLCSFCKDKADWIGPGPMIKHGSIKHGFLSFSSKITRHDETFLKKYKLRRTKDEKGDEGAWGMAPRYENSSEREGKGKVRGWGRPVHRTTVPESSHVKRPRQTGTDMEEKRALDPCLHTEGLVSTSLWGHRTIGFWPKTMRTEKPASQLTGHVPYLCHLPPYGNKGFNLPHLHGNVSVPVLHVHKQPQFPKLKHFIVKKNFFNV